MVLGYHFIFSAYGFWLPNDPRGSWSESIRQYELLAFGPPKKATGTRSLADVPHDAAQRAAAKQALKYSPVRFTGEQGRLIGFGLRDACAEGAYHLYALAVLPDHVHLVIGWHQRSVDEIAAHLKAKATRALTLASCHPMSRFSRNGRTPSPWARNYWCPFVRSVEQMDAAIAYVDRNPVKAGLPAQRWSFIDRWTP